MRAGTSAFWYQPSSDRWDEMFDAHGSTRSVWQEFHRTIAAAGSQRMNDCAATIERMLLDHGVTYNAYQDAGAAGRPWYLDVMPVLIESTDFSPVERGLHQRLRLFRAIMADVYGPQQLLKESWIPPQLLYSNPGYLRQMRGVNGDDDWIYTMATDLIRGQDGTWRALADRCQMPGGIGYALENRIVLSQTLPQEFKECRVTRLASFFESERAMFRDMASVHRQTPNVVMVTPGPHHRSYFEHAFKARYLGYPLVEGADLTVRDTRLFMKTLEGLRQVDVLIRRVEDWQCDTLELDPTSFSGIPGLLESWRHGRVKIANRPGSAVMESAAWLPYLNNLCQRLLGEECLLPSVETHWCGDQQMFARIRRAPQDWIFKKAFCGHESPAVAPAQMDRQSLQTWWPSVAAHPEAWVVQKQENLSQTPCWTGETLEPREFVWRTFICGTSQWSHVMPGGLGRVSPHRDGFMAAAGAGALSKDVWVISEQEVEAKTLLNDRGGSIRVSRPPGDVPSRIADHLYWLGRYAERMEQTTRVLRMLSKRLGGEGSESQMQELHEGLRLAQEVKVFDSTVDSFSPTATIWESIRQWIDDADRCDGIADLMGKLRYNAAAARDRLSDDTWRLFNQLREEVAQPLPHINSSAITRKLDRIVLDMAAFSGMQSENMVQGHGWRFLELGRRIERGTANATFLKAAIALCQDQQSVLIPLLEIFDSTMTYRRHHYAKPKLLQVIDLLMLHAANPRSLAYQIEAMSRQAQRLPQGSSITGATNALRSVEAMSEQLKHANLACYEGDETCYQELQDFCQSLLDQLEKFSNQLTEDYFSHATRRSR